MASITAVELGADTCALARTTVRGGEVTLVSAERLEPAEYPGIDAFTSALRQSRGAMGLSRRCRVVLWGLPEGADRKDAAVKPMLLPLTSAGFKVERVVTPCNALAALARVKTIRGDGATCWLAINRGGVAIVVVRPGEQIYAHSFVWDSTVGASGSQARLLQRYSLVAFLSPEVKRAIEAARSTGFPVEAVVTCGNLPDLRSLTMPLIEELDLEVETLDSFEGLTVKPAAAERLADVAAAIRLACAGVLARGARPWDPSQRPAATGSGALLRVAAAIALFGALAIGYAWYSRAPRREAGGESAALRPPPPAPKSNAPGAGAPASTRETKPPAVSAPAPAPKPNAPAVSAQATAPKSNPPAVSAQATAPKSNPPAVSARATAPKSNPPAVSARATAPKSDPPAMSAQASVPESNPPAVSARASVPESNPPVPTQAAPPSAPAGKPDARPVPGRAAVGRPATPTPFERPMPALLNDPMPRVTAILVSAERRYATVGDGQIVAVGDVLGRRVVIGIDEHALILREPSGVQVRVGLGGRVLGVERGG